MKINSKNQLTCQESFFSSVTKFSFSHLSKVWSTAQSKFPKNIYNFTIRYINNSLPTRKNLSRWGLSSSSECSFCLGLESLLHVVAGCQCYLDRFTWRHNSILNFLANTLQTVNGSALYADVPGFKSPSIITGDTYRPDLLLSLSNGSLYVVELTVGYETNLENNVNRKKAKYKELVKQLDENFNEVNFINLSMSSLGIFAQECSTFLEMLGNVGLDKNYQTWIPKLSDPEVQFNLDPPTYQQITNVIRKMKSSGSPCPLDQLSIICFKRCPYLRTYLSKLIQEIWLSGTVPNEWKKACTILIHKKGNIDDPSNFRPITLESIPLKVFTSCLRNAIYSFLASNNFIEHGIQKGFTPNLSGTLEHTAQMADIINKARIRQRSVVITLLDLKNAFGEVHHNLIQSNLSRWGLSSSSECSFCLGLESLLLVVAGCQCYLDRFTWRHNSILNFLANTLQTVNGFALYADVPGFKSPSIITGDTYRPDLLLSLSNDSLYVVELTVGYETNLENNVNRKKAKYKELVKQLDENFNEVNFINLSMSSLGIFAQECSTFLEMLGNVGLDKNYQTYCVRKMMTIAIRSSLHAIFFAAEIRNGK
ncbi:Hypothetical predicted protein, partial [Paramuricea clavata]